jgi:hypothetical protein
MKVRGTPGLHLRKRSCSQNFFAVEIEELPLVNGYLKESRKWLRGVVDVLRGQGSFYSATAQLDSKVHNSFSLVVGICPVAMILMEWLKG